MVGMEYARLPRFKQSAAIAPLRLTARDHEILRHVHSHRFLRSNHLTALLPGSRQQLLRRLQRLYHHGHLERPRCQIDYYHRGGSRAIAYGLGNNGAELLKRELSHPFHRLDWSSKNKVERMFLEHALMVSDVMVSLELACRKHPDIRLLSPDDLILPPGAPKLCEPFQWTVSLGNRVKCGVIPDRFFGIEFTGRAGPEQRSWFCLEADRATMPIMRQDLAKSSFYRKLLAYEATWTQNIHRSRFGFHRFRVLTVTTSPDRVKHFVDACRALSRGQGLFLFTDIASMNKHGDILTLPWQTGRSGGVESLIPATSVAQTTNAERDIHDLQQH